MGLIYTTKKNLLYINSSQFDKLLIQSLIVPHCNVIFADDIGMALSILYSNNIDLLVIDEKINIENQFQMPLFLFIKKLNIIDESKIFVLLSLYASDMQSNQLEKEVNILYKPLIKEDIYKQMSIGFI